MADIVTNTLQIGNNNLILRDADAQEKISDLKEDLSESVGDLKGALNLFTRSQNLIDPTILLSSSNTKIVNNGDGTYLVKRGDYGTSIFGSQITLKKGYYYLFGVDEGYSFLSTIQSEDDRFAVNTSKTAKLIEIASDTSCYVGLRLGSSPTVNFMIAPFVELAILSNAFVDSGIRSAVSLNTITETGMYSVVNCTDAPTAVANSGYGVLIVEKYALTSSDFYAFQTLMTFYPSDKSKTFVRKSSNLSGTVTWSTWEEVYNPDKGKANQQDANTILDDGNYFMYLCSNIPTEYQGQNGYMSVKRFSLDASTTYVTQTFVGMSSSVVDCNVYSRRSSYVQSSSISWSPWEKLTNSSIGGSLVGKKIVNFGDSIFGNWDGADSISATIARGTGATVYNCGFGGCRMANYTENQYYNEFSMCNLVDAIVANDYSSQVSAAAYIKANIDPSSYFPDRVTRLSSIDFSEVDVITIAYGCNDVTNSVLVDNANDPFDKDTYCGALRYALKELGENFPEIKIVVLTPIFEVYLSGGAYSFDSDDPNYGTKRGFTIDPTRKFTDYVEGALDVSREFHNLAFDEYYECGFNKYNYATYYIDGTHLNATGRVRRGERLSAKLQSVF